MGLNKISLNSNDFRQIVYSKNIKYKEIWFTDIASNDLVLLNTFNGC